MPCLQFQMFEKTCERSSDNNQQQSFKRFPQCTPRSSAGNQNGERVGGKWTVCYFLRNAQAPHVSATLFWNKSDLKRSGAARVTHIQIFLSYESFVEAEGTEWGIVVIMFSSRGGVWVRRSATCAGLRRCMWVIHANNQVWLLAFSMWKTRQRATLSQRGPLFLSGGLYWPCSLRLRTKGISDWWTVTKRK